MAQSPILPRVQAPLSGPGGIPTAEWYRFFHALRDLIGGDADLTARVDALEKEFAKIEAPQYTGPASVRISGTTISLLNDLAGPDPSSYYGTDTAGLKGWFSRLLSTLADVDMTGLADGDSLIWDAAQAKFLPGSGASGGNLDGGRASTIYGGTSPIDGGGA